MGILDSEALDLATHGSDLAGKRAGVVAGDAGSDDSTADTAGAAEVHLAADVDVGDYQTQVRNISICRLTNCAYRSCPRREEEGGGEWREAECQQRG